MKSVFSLGNELAAPIPSSAAPPTTSTSSIAFGDFETDRLQLTGVITSTAVGGKIEIQGSDLEDGLQVAILAPDAGEPIELSPEEQQELTLAMQEIRGGDFVDGDDLLEELRSRSPA